MGNVCKNGLEKRDGLSISMICSLDNKNCCLIRWCVEERCIKMSNNYYKYGCRKLGENNG